MRVYIKEVKNCIECPNFRENPIDLRYDKICTIKRRICIEGKSPVWGIKTAPIPKWCPLKNKGD